MHIQTCEGLSQLSSYYSDVPSEEETTMHIHTNQARRQGGFEGVRANPPFNL